MQPWLCSLCPQGGSAATASHVLLAGREEDAHHTFNLMLKDLF